MRKTTGKSPAHWTIVFFRVGWARRWWIPWRFFWGKKAISETTRTTWLSVVLFWVDFTCENLSQFQEMVTFRSILDVLFGFETFYTSWTFQSFCSPLPSHEFGGSFFPWLMYNKKRIYVYGMYILPLFTYIFGWFFYDFHGWFSCRYSYTLRATHGSCPGNCPPLVARGGYAASLGYVDAEEKSGGWKPPFGWCKKKTGQIMG